MVKYPIYYNIEVRSNGAYECLNSKAIAVYLKIYYVLFQGRMCDQIVLTLELV